MQNLNIDRGTHVVSRFPVLSEPDVFHTFRDEDSVAEELSMTAETFVSLGRFGMVQLTMTFFYPWGHCRREQ